MLDCVQDKGRQAERNEKTEFTGSIGRDRGYAAGAECTISMVMDMYTEAMNDGEEYETVATQEDFDRF